MTTENKQDLEKRGEPVENEEEEKADEASSPESARSPDHEKQNSLEPTTSHVSIAEKLPLWREAIFVTLICLAQLTTQISLGQTVAIIHVIGDSFGVRDPGTLSWLIAGYSLTVGTFILISGRFGDVFGYKKMLIIGFSWFSVWSMVSGLSIFSGDILFIFSRVLVGIGPSIALPNALAILGASYNAGVRKNMVFSFFGAVAPAGGVLGTTFGSLISLAWWPWTYWGLAIFLVAVVILCVFFVPDPQPLLKDAKKLTLAERAQQLDLLGGGIGILALILINFAWNQAPVVGWAQAYVYVLLIIGLLLIPVFFYVETRVATDPLIPFHALSGDVAFVLGCVGCGWGTFGIWYYYYWQFAEVLRGNSPLLVAAYQSPAAISGACASVATGFLLGKMRPAWVMVIALTAFLTGVILLATMEVDNPYWAQLFVSIIITPWGMDMSFPSGTIILSNSVSKGKQGIAASLVNTVVNYSISIALGIAGTVEQQVTNGEMTPEAILKGYRSAWYFGIGLSGFGLVLSIIFLIKSYINERKQA